jgi:hypothetical protein
MDAAIYGRDEGVDYQFEVDQITRILDKNGGSSVAWLGAMGTHAELLATAGYDLAEARADAAISALPVFGSQGSDQVLRAALAAARDRLHPDGLFVFQVLDATTILRQESLSGFVPIRTMSGWLVRSFTGSVDPLEQVVRAKVQRWSLDGDRLSQHSEWSHYVRFFLPRELELLLSVNGFRLIDTMPLGEREWSRLAWARRT